MKKSLLPIGVVILILTTLIIRGVIIEKDEIRMPYPLFQEKLETSAIEEVILTPSGNDMEVTLLNDTTTYLVTNPKTDTLVETLLTHNVIVSYENDAIPNTTLVILLLLAIGAFAFIIIKLGRSGEFSIKKATHIKKEDKVTFQDVAGNVEAKSMVSDIISFIKEPEKYSELGAKMPKGLLFYGPPGTGKTLMAKALANEAGVPFYAMSGSDFVQMYVGVGASRIRTLFQKAKKHKKAVIFIDEIDAIGKQRSKNPNASNDERDQTLNALLTEMSGFHENHGIVVIGATNRLDTLDEALLRPGRFDRQIEINLPDINARENILRHYIKNKPISSDVDIQKLAKSTTYFSGAMLEHLVNESAILAANESSNEIRWEHIDKAFYTVLAGAPKQDVSYITNKEKEITAYHEAGHALITHLLQPEREISKVTIIPSIKGAGGFNLSIAKDSMYQTSTQLINSIKVFLAGRCAEEYIYGPDSITTGASNDIERASNLLYQYYNTYGMDKDMGMFSTKILNKETDETIIHQCRIRMRELYDETYTLIEANASKLEAITTELLESENLDGDDINRLCA